VSDNNNYGIWVGMTTSGVTAILNRITAQRNKVAGFMAKGGGSNGNYNRIAIIDSVFSTNTEYGILADEKNKTAPQVVVMNSAIFGESKTGYGILVRGGTTAAARDGAVVSVGGTLVEGYGTGLAVEDGAVGETRGDNWPIHNVVDFAGSWNSYSLK
jgi:hypothetical protein